MKHVQQQTLNSCMSSCISMITGIDINEVIEQFGNDYISQQNGQDHLIFKYLIKNGFVPYSGDELSISGSVSILPDYFYILGVPSLGKKGKWHAVVVYFEDDEPVVLDPMYGKGLSYVYGIYANNDNLIDMSDVETIFDVAIKSNKE